VKGKKIISNTIEAIQNSWEFIFRPKKKLNCILNAVFYAWNFECLTLVCWCERKREKKLLQLSYFSKFLPEHICLNSHLIADPCPSLSLHFYPYSWSKCKRELRESERTGLVHIIKPLSGSGDCCMCVCVWEREREREREGERERESCVVSVFTQVYSLSLSHFYSNPFSDTHTFIQYLYNTFQKDVHFWAHTHTLTFIERDR